MYKKAHINKYLSLAICFTIVFLCTSCKAIFFKDFRKDYNTIIGGKITTLNKYSIRDTIVFEENYKQKSEDGIIDSIRCTCINEADKSKRIEGFSAFALQFITKGYSLKLFRVEDDADINGELLDEIKDINFYLVGETEIKNINYLISDSNKMIKKIMWMDSKGINNSSMFIRNDKYRSRLTGCSQAHKNFFGLKDFIRKSNVDLRLGDKYTWYSYYPFVFYLKDNLSLVNTNYKYLRVEIKISEKRTHKKKVVVIETAI